MIIIKLKTPNFVGMTKNYKTHADGKFRHY